AVLAVVMSVARIVVVKALLLTYFVDLELPFQRTTEWDVNPVPVTCSVKPLPPGTTLAGTSGWLRCGTALLLDFTPVPISVTARGLSAESNLTSNTEPL